MINIQKVDYKKFKKDTNNNETRITRKSFVSKNVISNQRPNSTIEFLSNKQQKKNY